MPLSCAGHRGLNRSASIESVDGSPQGCYVNWQQNNQPVKGNDNNEKNFLMEIFEIVFKLMLHAGSNLALPAGALHAPF